MDAKLVVIGGKANMGEVKLRLPMTIGRGSKADLIISHPTVSREHCKLTEINGELLVTDNGSSNGTFVDGDKIEKPTIVRSGQILAIGPLTFRAEYESKVAKKPKTRAPDKSGLAETQAVDRSEFDIDFILDDNPSAQVQAAVPKKPAAANADSKSTAGKSAETTKQVPKTEAKAPAPPAKDAAKDKSPAAPRVGETDEMDLDFLLDDVAKEKKQAPANRDTDQIDIDALDLIAGEEKPKAPTGDDLTTDFRDERSEKVAAEKTVEFHADELDLGDDFFADEKIDEPTEAAAASPAAPEAKSPKVEKQHEETPAPLAKEKTSGKPAAQDPAAKAPPARAPEKPKKGGAPDFDFLSAGAAAPKEEVTFDDFATQFDFSGKSPKPELPVAPPQVAAETPAIEMPVEEKGAEETAVEDVAATKSPATDASTARDDEAMFDDFLADLGNDATPASAASVEEAAPEAPDAEEPAPESPLAAADDFSLDDLVDEVPTVEESKPAEAVAAATVEEDESPFSEPVAPPAASELPAMPELAEPKEPVFDDGMFALDEPAAIEPPAAAAAAAVAPAEKVEEFTFDAPPAEVPVFDAASENMSLEEAIAAETPATHEPLPTEEPVAPTKTDDALDFDFLSDMDPPAIEAPPAGQAEEPSPIVSEDVVAEKVERLADISLDLDEVPAAPAGPAFDQSAMNETQDIDLRANADENPLAAPMVEMMTPAVDKAPAIAETPAKVETLEFDFLAPDASAKQEESPFDFSKLEESQSSASVDQTAAFSAPVEEAPAKEAPAAAAADDFDFLAGESPASDTAAPEASPPAASTPGAMDFDVAAKNAAKTEEFDFGMFGETESKSTPPAGVTPIGPSVKEPAATSEELPGAISFDDSPAAPPITAPSSTTAKAKPPAAPKLSFIDKIKMLFGGGKAKANKTKPAKSKSTQGVSDAPEAKLPPLAPAKPALDPIPLDDAPAPSFDFEAPAAENPAADRPAFDFGETIALESAPAEATLEPIATGVPKGWTPIDAPIPLDESPIDFGIEPEKSAEPVASAPPEAPAPEAAPTAEETAPWDDIELSPATDVSESNAPFTLGDAEASRSAVEASEASKEKFDFLATDDSVLDASANPEAQALALQSASEAVPAPDAPVVEAPAAAAPTVDAAAPETPAAESAAAADDDWMIDDLVAEVPAVAPEHASIESSNSESPAAESPTVDDWMASLDAAPQVEAASPAEAATEPESDALNLVDDVTLTESAPTSEPAKEELAAESTNDVDSWLDDIAPAAESPAVPAAESPASEPAEFMLSDEPGAAADATMAWTAPSDASPVSESPASEPPAAETGEAWSFEELGSAPQADAAAAPPTEAPAADLGFADVAGSPAAELPTPTPAGPTPPAAPLVSKRPRQVDVDLRLSSSLLSLTRLAVRPPRIDMAEMEPDLPSGRSFEPRPKSPPPAASPASAMESTSEPAIESTDAPAANEFPPATEADAENPSFDDWSTPPAPVAEPPAAPSEGAAAATVEEFSFLDDIAPPETTNAAATAPSEPTAEAADAPTHDTDRTVAYLGTPKVVEEAESFLASLDESAAAAPAPDFNLDAMLADAERTNPAEAAPAAEALPEPTPAADELSFLSLSDEVVESEPVAEVPAPVKPEEAAHAPSADADFGFLDLLEEKEAQVDALGDFNFDAPESGQKDAPKAEGVKTEPVSPEGGKNGTKPTPQPAAASPAADSDLDDFLRDLGMN